MKCLIYDIAADSSGALSILKLMYEYAKKHSEHEWIFFVCNRDLIYDNDNNIQIYEFSRVKKNWINRLFFDKYTAPRLINKLNPDIIVNFQNVYVKSKVKQVLYLHQPLPFIKHRFSIFDFKLWVYQNVIGKMIYSSCKKSQEIIVQTSWMKEAIIGKKLCESNKIRVIPVDYNSDSNYIYSEKNDNNEYFYPATPLKYKNHLFVLKALKEAQKINEKICFYFTVSGNENKYSRKLLKYVNKNNLNVKFLGRIPQEKVFEYYTHCTLLFPSYVETFGLPLLEARNCNSPIVSLKTPWALEILSGYSNVRFFEENDLNSLIAFLINK